MGKLIDDPALKNRTHVFADRAAAGKKLAALLQHYRGRKIRLFAIPAGGVPVAAEIARALSLPLDLVIVRKIQLPWTTEAGFGALNPGGEAIFNEDLLRLRPLTAEDIDRQVAQTRDSMAEREQRLRGGKPYPPLEHLTVMLVDDGLASGYTMRAAIKFLQARDAGPIIVAVPTASERTVQELLPLVDELYCPNVRSGWSFAVAEAYENWYDLGEAEVLEILKSLEINAEVAKI
jgi:putative phosphoribosyl transferase